MYDARAFRQERASWRAIIQLNVVRSVHIILDAITQAFSNQSTFQDPSSSFTSIPHSTPDLPYIEEDLIRLKYRLQPLLRAEEVLTKRLTVRGETEPTKFDTRPHRSPTSSRNDSDPTVYDYSHATHVEHRRTQSAGGAMPGGTQREPVVYSTTQWKDLFGRFRNAGGVRQSYDSQNPVDWDDPNDPGRVLYECRQDIKDLWEHRTVQELLEKQNLRLEEMAGL
jgi:guanine nucleotide-binding protein alpha-1 subunit